MVCTHLSDVTRVMVIRKVKYERYIALTEHVNSDTNLYLENLNISSRSIFNTRRYERYALIKKYWFYKLFIGCRSESQSSINASYTQLF